MNNKNNNHNNNSLPQYVNMIPDKSCPNCNLSTDISSDQFVLQNTTCHIKDPFFSDPNQSRFKVFGRSKNYSKYECKSTPDDVYRFMIQGQRNPVPCQLSQPFITYDGKNDVIDFMASCGDLKYMGYNRNGRYIKSIYDE